MVKITKVLDLFIMNGWSCYTSNVYDMVFPLGSLAQVMYCSWFSAVTLIDTLSHPFNQSHGRHSFILPALFVNNQKCTSERTRIIGCRKYSEGCDNCYMFYQDEQRDKDGNIRFSKLIILQNPKKISTFIIYAFTI